MRRIPVSPVILGGLAALVNLSCGKCEVPSCFPLNWTAQAPPFLLYAQDASATLAEEVGFEIKGTVGDTACGQPTDATSSDERVRCAINREDDYLTSGSEVTIRVYVSTVEASEVPFSGTCALVYDDGNGCSWSWSDFEWQVTEVRAP